VPLAGVRDDQGLFDLAAHRISPEDPCAIQPSRN
jgi:hypothetical protein